MHHLVKILVMIITAIIFLCSFCEKCYVFLGHYIPDFRRGFCAFRCKKWIRRYLLIRTAAFVGPVWGDTKCIYWKRSCYSTVSCCRQSIGVLITRSVWMDACGKRRTLFKKIKNTCW